MKSKIQIQCCVAMMAHGGHISSSAITASTARLLNMQPTTWSWLAQLWCGVSMQACYKGVMACAASMVTIESCIHASMPTCIHASMQLDVPHVLQILPAASHCRTSQCSAATMHVVMACMVSIGSAEPCSRGILSTFIDVLTDAQQGIMEPCSHA